MSTASGDKWLHFVTRHPNPGYGASIGYGYFADHCLGRINTEYDSRIHTSNPLSATELIEHINLFLCLGQYLLKIG